MLSEPPQVVSEPSSEVQVAAGSCGCKVFMWENQWCAQITLNIPTGSKAGTVIVGLITHELHLDRDLTHKALSGLAMSHSQT